MIFTQIRHGSHIIEYKDKRFLVDPVLDNKGSVIPIPKGRVQEKNPLVELPFDIDFLDIIDAVLITHMHFDHFDRTAMTLIPKSTIIYCQAHDVRKIKKAGFAKVINLDGPINISSEITIEAVKGGKHGTGIAGKLMGKSIGYVIKDASITPEEPTVYIIGDSIWCEAVKNGITTHKPNVIIAFAGEAKLPFGKPITMTTDDLWEVARRSGEAKIIVNHMDVWNHCYLTRSMLRRHIKGKPFEKRFSIPEDGEVCVFKV